MRYPRLFLWRSVATVGRLEKTIGTRFPAELVDLAKLPLWIYIRLKAEIGQAKAFEIMRVAILTGGIAQWNLAYETVARERTFENLCDQELRVNRAGPTKWNTLEVIDRTKDRFEVRVTQCLCHELATFVGVPEFTPVVCQLDNAGFNSYLPDRVVFHRGRPGSRIADGAPSCHFVWERQA